MTGRVWVGTGVLVISVLVAAGDPLGAAVLTAAFVAVLLVGPGAKRAFAPSRTALVIGVLRPGLAGVGHILQPAGGQDSPLILTVIRR